MREIKFRAKGVDGEWWYGEDNPSKDYRHVNLAAFFVNLYNCQFDDKTLGEYTGLKDKNGQEIYEGDIVRYYGYEVRDGKQIRPEKTEVVANERKSWIASCYRLLCLDSTGTHRLEVIGSIYENPELLEDGDGE